MERLEEVVTAAADIEVVMEAVAVDMEAAAVDMEEAEVDMEAVAAVSEDVEVVGASEAEAEEIINYFDYELITVGDYFVLFIL